MAYKVELPDGSWQSTDDLTGADLEAIERATSIPWSLLNPLRDIGAYRAIVAAFAIRQLDMSDDDLKAWFAGRTLTQLVDGLERVDDAADLPGSFVDGLPKAEDGPGTGTSAGSPVPPSAGPQT